METETPFSFEGLDVYRFAVNLAKDVHRVLGTVPRGHRQLADQFRRAAISIHLNLAEGSGRYHPSDKKRFYVIARGSCFECVSALELSFQLDLVDKRTHDDLRNRLRRIALMLTKLMQRTGETK